MDNYQTKTYKSKHKDIPGNPSTAKSSRHKLNIRKNEEPLRVLTEEQWKFWLQNGYVVIKNALPKNQAEETASFLWEFEDKKPMMFSSEIRMIPKIDFETNQKDVTLPGQSIQENGELDASFAESQIPKTGKGQADVDSKEISSI